MGIVQRLRVVSPFLSIMAAAFIALTVGVLGLMGIMRTEPNECVMTYMYPNYIPIIMGSNRSRYGLYYYHEGWKQVDFQQEIRELSGMPVLYVPGNGGSHKQVRSLAAESERGFEAGPPEDDFYLRASLTRAEAGGFENVPSGESAGRIPRKYRNKLNWFTADLAGELSALDSRILEDQSDFIVMAVDRILELYREGRKEMKEKGLLVRDLKGRPLKADPLPESVILVGHSMGGMVARAVLVHPKHTRGTVDTIMTLSSPHLVSPMAVQPSLGRFFIKVNNLWRRGYSAEARRGRRKEPETKPAPFSNVVVVSIAGGSRDSQVRTGQTQLVGVVPPTNFLSTSTTTMPNAWLSTDHQCILWCNQVVVQVSRTLLLLADPDTKQAHKSPTARMAIFAAHLRGALPQALGWTDSILPPVLHPRDDSDDEIAQEAAKKAAKAAAHKKLLAAAGRTSESEDSKPGLELAASEGQAKESDASLGKALTLAASEEAREDGSLGGSREGAEGEGIQARRLMAVDDLEGAGRGVGSAEAAAEGLMGGGRELLEDSEDEKEMVEREDENGVNLELINLLGTEAQQELAEKARKLEEGEAVDDEDEDEELVGARGEGEGGWGSGGRFGCPKSRTWIVEPQEVDLFIEQQQTITITERDGRRRWLDIQAMAAKGKDHFVLSTNLKPCGSVRVHLWRQRTGTAVHTAQAGSGNAAFGPSTTEVTLKLVQFPAGPSPGKPEQGSEQPQPTAMLLLSPLEMMGYRFMTITVAPRPAAGMFQAIAVGQFYNREDLVVRISQFWLLSSLFRKREVKVEENHNLIVNLTLPFSPGVVPSSLRATSTKCGSDSFGIEAKEAAAMCMMQCIPGAAVMWDPYSGQEIVVHNIRDRVLAPDATPSIWNGISSGRQAPASLLLILDPRCAYDIQIQVPLIVMAGRFLLSHGIQIATISMAILLFSLAHQSRGWKTASTRSILQPIPPLPISIASSLLPPLSPLLFFVIPSSYLLLRRLLSPPPFPHLNKPDAPLPPAARGDPPFLEFLLSCALSLLLASGLLVILAIVTDTLLQLSVWLEVHGPSLLASAAAPGRPWSRLSGFLRMGVGPRKALGGGGVGVVGGGGIAESARWAWVVSGAAVACTVLVHPAVGLVVVLAAEAFGARLALLRHVRRKGLSGPQSLSGGWPRETVGTGERREDLSAIDLFHIRHGVLLLHLLSATLLLPSLIGWLQRPMGERKFPAALDAWIVLPAVLHGLLASHPEASSPPLPLPLQLPFRPPLQEVGISIVYTVAGVFCFLAGLDLAPYAIFCAVAVIGTLSSISLLREWPIFGGSAIARRRYLSRHD